jgi:tetratricopeptide (TPR) repeat protein
MTRPIFIMGDVVTGDGTPVPRNIEIHRVCNGRDRREGYTDSAGHFSFQLGGEQVMQDASSDDSGFGSMPGQPSSMGMGMGSLGSSSGSGSQNLFGCELKAVAAGFRSSSIELATYRAEEPIVGKLVLERVERVQGTMISATSAAAPKDAQKAYKKGVDLEKKGKFEEAQQRFIDATNQYPRYADAWLEVGRLYLRQNQPDAAKNAFQQAIAADSRFVAPYVGLASIEAIRQNWQETARLTDQAITLDPIDFPNGYFYNSVANFNLGHFDAAEKSARKAATLDSQHRLPQIQSLLGRILLMKKDYPGALENFRSYLKNLPDAADAPDIRRQVQTLEQAAASAPAQRPRN